MQNLFEIVMFSIIGAALFFGYTMFFRNGIPFLKKDAKRKNSRMSQKYTDISDYYSAKSNEEEQHYYTDEKEKSKKKMNKTCPVCNTKLENNETVNSYAYPSFNREDRFMHIRGCPFCLNGKKDRVCPVCKIMLEGDEVLICRLFDRPGQRVHIHVLGCTKCRGR